MPLPTKAQKAQVLKVFILDVQGGYQGEYVVDEECVVEYSDVLAVIPDAGLGEGQPIFLGEYRATALYGEKLGLIAISKGPLGKEELTWAKAALVATEATLGGAPDPAAPAPGPDKGVMESLARALDEREAQLRAQEVALAEMEEHTKAAVQEYRHEMETRLEDLKAQLAAAQQQHEASVKALAEERDRLHQELEAIAKAPKEKGPTTDPGFEAARKQVEKDRKFLQRRAVDLLAREESVRDREMKLEEDMEKLANLRDELEVKRAEIEAAKAAKPDFDVEAARREIETRVKILQQKAFDLLDREEKLRKQAERLHALMESAVG